jgi:hypothetical protein
MTTTISLSIRRGTSPTLVFAVTDRSTGAAKNLTGASEISFAIGAGRSATERDLILSLTDPSPPVSHDGSAGNVTVQITAAQTEALTTGTRWCELWITDINGKTDLVAEGNCTVYDTLITVAA